MKTKIFLDCDDTILESSKCVINILNKKYNLHKTIEDLKDFNYRSIYGQINREEVFDIFESEEFWENVEINELFKENIEALKDDFEIVFVSCGTDKNLDKKSQYLKKYFDFEFIGKRISVEKVDLKKDYIDMNNAIQIDDNPKSLKDTNAAIKIFLQNGRDVKGNDAPINEDNLYVVQNWNEILEILNFFKLHPEFVMRCY